MLEKCLVHENEVLLRQKIEIIRFFSLYYFYLDANVSLKQQQKINFSVHSRKFKTRKIIFWPIRENLCSRNAKISRIFRLAKVYAPKVCKFQVPKKLCRSLEHPLSRTSLYLEPFSRSLSIDSSLIFFSLSRTLSISNKFLSPLGVRDS